MIEVIRDYITVRLAGILTEYADVAVLIFLSGVVLTYIIMQKTVIAAMKVGIKFLREQLSFKKEVVHQEIEKLKKENRELKRENENLREITDELERLRHEPMVLPELLARLVGLAGERSELDSEFTRPPSPRHVPNQPGETVGGKIRRMCARIFGF